MEFVQICLARLPSLNSSGTVSSWPFVIRWNPAAHATFLCGFSKPSSTQPSHDRPNHGGPLLPSGGGFNKSGTKDHRLSSTCVFSAFAHAVCATMPSVPIVGYAAQPRTFWNCASAWDLSGEMAQDERIGATGYHDLWLMTAGLHDPLMDPELTLTHTGAETAEMQGAASATDSVQASWTILLSLSTPLRSSCSFPPLMQPARQILLQSLGTSPMLPYCRGLFLTSLAFLSWAWAAVTGVAPCVAGPKTTSHLIPPPGSGCWLLAADKTDNSQSTRKVTPAQHALPPPSSHRLYV